MINPQIKIIVESIVSVYVSDLLVGKQTHFFMFSQMISKCSRLVRWDRVTLIWVGDQTTIGPDNGLSPGRRQAIIWTNAGSL